MSKDAELKEQLISNSIERGDTALAIQLIVDAVVDFAKTKDFESAEKYRDRLYDVDPTALNAIIKANEIIDAEKSAGFTSDHYDTWEKLYDSMSEDEANTLFLTMKELTLEPDEYAIEQGRSNDRLFFINQGQLKIVHTSDNRELLINRLGIGNIFGEDTFFSINICTSSVVALSRAHVHYLDKQMLLDLIKKQAHLETNLRSYCRSEAKIQQMLQNKGMDRRSFRRYRMSAKVHTVVVKPDTGKPLSRPFIGELYDISRGGLCFYLKSKNVKTMRMLTGRNLSLKFTLPFHGVEKKLKILGLVQGVQDHPFDEYSIHIKFNKILKREVLRALQE